MSLPDTPSLNQTTLLRIFLDKFQKHHFTSTYIAIVQAARKQGLAGATVLECIEGFGQNGKLLRDREWPLSSDTEMIIEIIDDREKLRDFLDLIEPWLEEAVITLQPVKALRLK